MVGKAKLAAGIQDATKKGFALEQGNFSQIVSIAIKQIKQVVSYWIARKQIGRGPLHIHALLHTLEVTAPFFIEDDNLTIQKCTAGADVPRQIGQFGILVCKIGRASCRERV